MGGTQRVAIITGGSRGLGAVVAQILAARGYDLVVGARDGHALQAAGEELRRTGRRVVTVRGDIADPRVRSGLIHEARQMGGLDVLVNNASELGAIEPVLRTPAERLDRVFRVNVAAPVQLVQLAAPLLRARGGLVVNVTSDAARGAYPGWGVYGASKSALELLSRTLHAELFDQGIAVVGVDPGDIRTRMHQEAYPEQDISDRPEPTVTGPFWEWLFDRDWREIAGERFEAQQEDAAWQPQLR